MELAETLRRLEALGSEQTRKIFRRHGAGEKMYGVKYGDLEGLRKEIKRDHALALQLWATGNHDARTLATMIADPAQIDEAQAAALAGEAENHIQADALAGLVAKNPYAWSLAERWLDSDRPNLSRLAWSIVGTLANRPAGEDERFMALLPAIEAGIHTRPNRIREAMNWTLIAIGVRSERLAAEAVAVAGRIGKVTVDHGDTSCKTPDAIPYIRKGRAHRVAQAEKDASKKKRSPVPAAKKEPATVKP